MGTERRGRWIERLSLAEHLLEQQLELERRHADRPRYAPDLLTDFDLLAEVFEIQSQRVFVLMRQAGLSVPERDPEARRRRALK